MLLVCLFALTSSGEGAAKKPAKKHSAYGMQALFDHGGKKTSLQQQAAGKRLVVVVMKGTWCQVCVKQLKRLAKMRAELAKLGTRVVAITTESSAKNAALAKREKLPFTILSDPKHRVLSQLGLWRDEWGHPLPSMVVFDKCGAERARLEGRRPGVRPVRSLLKLLSKLEKKPAVCSAPNA